MKLLVKGDEIEKSSDEDLVHDIGSFLAESQRLLVQANRYVGELDRRRRVERPR